MLCGVVMSKECTNVPTQLSSHSLRYELLSSKNESWKEQMFSHYHLTSTDDSAWSILRPRKMLKEEEKFDWMMMYGKIKNSGGVKAIDGILNEVSLHGVRIEPNSMHGIAQQTNLEYLLIVWCGSFGKLQVWRLLVIRMEVVRLRMLSFAVILSVITLVPPHRCGLAHITTASKQKMSAVVSALSACQEKMGSGYLSAFPSELFDLFEAIKPVWAPYYTIHKILAGLLDQYTVAGNVKALMMTTWMAEYFYNRVQKVITKYTIERHWLSLNEETGGMNDVLYKLYSVTGDSKNLRLAHLFDKPCFLVLLAVKADDISGCHANAHIPVVVGSQMPYEVTGDPLYKEIGTYFMDIVNSSHSYATGGISVDEFWSDPKWLARTENEESCTTYNMLKVSRHLFKWTKEMAYADYYERALTNGVLTTTTGEHNSIPFGAATGLIQYIPSSLDWKSGKVSVSQKIEPVVSWDNRLRVIIRISSTGRSSGPSSTLNLRIPIWTHSSGVNATLNGKDLSLPTPGNFLTVTNTWGQGDKITLELPMILRTEAIKDDRPEHATVQAILFGPYLLAGHSSGDWYIVANSTTALSDLITPIPADYNANLISLMQESGNTTFVLTNSNQSFQMEKYPEAGTNAAVSATFRLISLDKSSVKPSEYKDLIGKQVMLELFDLPEMFISHQGQEQSLGIADSSDEGGSLFRVTAGLDGKDSTVSLESESQKGCFIYSGVDYKSSSTVKLSSNTKSSDAGFKQAASFTFGNGISIILLVSSRKGQRETSFCHHCLALEIILS
ncbi:hypothetical protein T459_31515 [Capsicum annuum]|uniref:Alpha-L-arabinofuranosidase B arabinose-binding domain-containing protein n=1 Tax=Capsicum annuum TaxID=4072 RepID=A0A2G2YBJ0_CAPAN|nr:putative U-box domain-containing protein 4-like [Capsicum annuum]PHT67090.1 hypothetical protein T459_31515 [Capsicum annuum]